ncbi:prepilin peptidase [Vibrio cholerae]|uniref:prepilin peptidase n=1 Tax=Vibrio cholerae TaxID=666 RepID=UPI0021AFBDCC|nr:A24 family peptidase [Vibrio cholerae]
MMDLTPLFMLYVMVLGLCIGSFLNVVIYRLPVMILNPESGVNLWWPHSFCPNCRTSILKRDNIPVVSWLWLRGRCRHCHSAIPIRYPLSEFFIGLTFTGIFVLCDYHWSIELFLLFSLVAHIYCIVIIDYKDKLIPDALLISLFITGCGYHFFVSEIAWYEVAKSLTFTLIVIGLTYAFWKCLDIPMALGLGDIKLFLVLSVFLTFDEFLLLIPLSVFISILAYFFEKKARRTSVLVIPFGPSICLGFLFLFFV